MNRREFLHQLGLGTLALAQTAAGSQSRGEMSSPPMPPIVDFHVHLFGVGDGGTGCWLSATQKRHVTYRYFLKLLGLRENGRMDQDYIERMVAQLKTATVRQAVLQAWDCRYDAQGEPDLARTTSVYVPNDYLFKVVREHTGLFVPCASINPQRRDAQDELERCAANGARVVKIHPPTMDVDPAEPRYRGFYRRCAELKILLMAHTGTEHAAEIVGLENCDPRKLSLALEEGCTCIAAHGGFGAFFDAVDFSRHLAEMIRRYPHFYFDTAVLASMFRWRNLPSILKDTVIMSRAIHASDFPFPANAAVFWYRLNPADTAALVQEKNLFERDYRLKLALGVPPEVFQRGAQLLAGELPAA